MVNGALRPSIPLNEYHSSGSGVGKTAIGLNILMRRSRPSLPHRNALWALGSHFTSRPRDLRRAVNPTIIKLTMIATDN